MIDTGLLISVVALVAVPVLWSRLGNSRVAGERLTDAAITPLVVGLLTARVATLLLDDPEALRSFRDASVIRGGVEFWPGVAVAVIATAWTAHRSGRSPTVRLADLAPFALAAYAVFEATCIIREGCFGPRSPIGIQPTGLQSTMFPLGWLVAALVAATAVVIHRSDWAPTTRVWLAVTVVSSTRSVASFWLPKIGDGPTRAHQWSMAVAAMSVVAGIALFIRRGRGHGEPASKSGAHGVVDHGR